MQYDSPQMTDMDNVQALNEAFLTLLRRSSTARQCLSGLREDLARRLISLSPRQAKRLAEVPFLLFSFRERDERLWSNIFDLDPNEDLFVSARPAHDEASSLIAAGLGFIWQLARQNPYALRLLCGASVHWCEQISDNTLIQILGFASGHQELLVARLEKHSDIWRKLLDSGIHHRVDVRRAAHMSVLQTVLTQPDHSSREVWATAACRTALPLLKVADTDKN